MAIKSYQSMSDPALLDEVLIRDQAAWRELLRRFRGLMIRCISKVAGRYSKILSNEDTSEIFSDLCVGLLRDDMHKLRAYDPSRGMKLSSWLGLLAINTAYDYLRYTARRPVVHSDECLTFASDDTGPSALESLLQKERWRYLRELLSDFSPCERRFVELYYGNGLEPEEVAAAMKISVKTVYSKKNKLTSKLIRLADTSVFELACA